MNQAKITSMIWGLLLVAILAVEVRAQSEAGSCAGVQGTVEVQHAGAWQNAGIGSPVFVGDHVRTAAHSRATLVFRDDSVLDLAPNSEISIETLEFDESARHYRSLLHLAAGKVRVWASAYYSEARARYEVETPTAVVAVRGTQFIVAYDSGAEFSEVIGLDGRVEVSARLAVMGTGVDVGPRVFTRVPKGKFPTTPQRVDETRLPEYLAGVDLVGTGRRDGLNVLHPAVVGRVLAPQDVPGTPGGPVPPATATGLAGATALSIRAPLPGSVVDNMSADVYTNTQPLLDFQRVPPGAAPPGSTGGVHVGF